MFRTPGAARQLLSIVPGLVILLVTSAPAIAQSRTAELGIETAEEYADFVDAIRASEYVRQEFIVDGGAPRVIAAMAGLAAFADANPLATPTQFDAFVAAHDAALAGAVADDPDLRRPGAVLSGLTLARVQPLGDLAGTDTAVSTEALGLLGYALPGLDGLEQAERRMSTFDRRAIARLTHSAAFADVLVANLLGIDGEGITRDGLASASVLYLVLEGFDPMLGEIDPAQTEVNAGLAALPDFAGFMALKSQQEPTAATDALIATIDAMQLESDAMLAAIASATIPDTLAQDSAQLIENAENGDAAALAFLASQQMAIEARAKAVADERANLFASTLILMQSEFPDVRFEAQAARDFGAIQFESNEGLAVAEQSVGILGSAAAIAGAYATGNVFAGITATADLVSGAIGLGRTLSDDPGPEEQIFNQITELRSQVEGLRVEMNARFDIVDAKLDTIFQTLVFGLDQINNIAQTVDQIVQSIFEVQAQLSRLEEALFLLAEIEFQSLLNTDASAVLEYRQDNGQDLPYATGATNFVNGTVDFTSFATFNAINEPFVDTAYTLTIANADEEIGDGAIGRRFIALNTVPAGLSLADGTPYSPPPFFGGDIPAPAAWSQPAAMYAQLARENPWYFAFQHASQTAAMPGATDLDRIADRGEAIRTYATSLRDPQLFEALVENARDSADAAQSAITAQIDAVRATLPQNTLFQRLDPFGPIDQGNFENVLSRLNTLDVIGVSSFSDPRIPSDAPRRGYSVAVGNTIDTDIPGVSSRNDLLDRVFMARASNAQPGDNFFVAAFFDGFTPGNETEFTYLIIIALDRGNDQRWLVVRELTVQARSTCGFLFFVSQETVEDGMRQILGNSFSSGDLMDQLIDGDARNTYETSVEIFEAGPCGPFSPPPDLILEVVADVTFAGNYDPGNTPEDFDSDIAEGLAALRADVRSGVTDALVPGEPTAFNAAIDGLEDAESLIDAYATLALEDALGRSEILRSALRGFSDVGFRRDNIVALVGEAEAGDTGAIGGNPDFELTDLGAELNARLDIILGELNDAILAGGPTFPYVEFVLAELNALRDAPADLARGDTYLSTLSGISVNAAEGLLANDVLQAGRVVEIDPDFFASADAIAPQNGALTVNGDGSFDYTPDAGFSGTDVFNYRLRALIDESSNPVGDPYAYSDAALVIVRIEAGPCLADIDGNGILNFDDIDAFIAGFLGGDLVADLDGNGILNFDDIDAFVASFLAGCP
ncbi:MAG: Ig-like domain-containing protein [Phycisphaerales bacterium]